MRLVVRITTGDVVYKTSLVTEGGQMTMPSAEAAMAAAVQATGLDPAELVSWPAPDRVTAEALLLADLASLVATIVDGQVVGVVIDPDYTPPAPTPDPVQARLEALEATLEQLPLNTPHNRRWLAQKDRVKATGIAYIQARPACEQAELEQALALDLAAGFPGEPLVVNPAGVILSYADAAAAQGFIGQASFAALRDLVAASSPAQIQAMLQTL